VNLGCRTPWQLLVGLLRTCPFKWSTLEPSAWEQLTQEGQSLMLGIWGNCSDSPCSAHGKDVVQSRNQVPILYSKMRRPHSSCTKVWTQISHRCALPSGKTWAVLWTLLRGICCSQECTKCRNKASVRGCTKSYY
jgi:hypothetical protein